MRGFASKKVRPLLVLAATVVLGTLALAVGYFMVDERRHLLEHGLRTDGVVVGVDIGVRGLRSVEVEFTAADGRKLVGRDLHGTQWYAANDIGDTVELYYDPDYAGLAPPDILVDRGARVWSVPLFLVLGGSAVLVCGFFIARQARNGGR